jgi:hypothetical protein
MCVNLISGSINVELILYYILNAAFREVLRAWHFFWYSSLYLSFIKLF